MPARTAIGRIEQQQGQTELSLLEEAPWCSLRFQRGTASSPAPSPAPCSSANPLVVPTFQIRQCQAAPRLREMASLELRHARRLLWGKVSSDDAY